MKFRSLIAGIVLNVLFANTLVMAQNTAWVTSGPIGIGTTSPNGIFNVNGVSLLAGVNSNLDSHIANMSLNYLANSGQLLVGWNRTGGAGEADFISNQAGGGTGGFLFRNHDNSNNETSLMWVMGNGQVLIGNTQGKQGNYLLAVAGSAVATSFTVKTVDNWPDYIFKPTYHLPTLNEVKTYIDQNHRLPEMPSEQEVTDNGLNLGEMVKLQTKKIEELTLYLIEKDKQVSDQQKQLADQQKVNQSLQRQINDLAKQFKY